MQEIAPIITAISLVITALASLISVFASLRNGRKLDAVQHSTNGLKDELVASTKLAATSAGYMAGKTEGRRAQKEDDDRGSPK